MSYPHSLTVKINNNIPVLVEDFTDSLHALADEYTRHLAKHQEEYGDYEPKLYIEKIESGSIVATLCAVAPNALAIVDAYNTMIPFVTTLKGYYDYILGNSDKAPEGATLKSYSNVSKIVEHTAKDGGSSISLHVENSPNCTIVIGSPEANTVQNKTRKMLENKHEASKFYDRVLLTFFQARNDPKSKTGDKAIVESITPSPVRTIFASELNKIAILSNNENLFRYAFLVDIQVQSIRGRPTVYTIIDVLDKIEIQHSAQSDDSPLGLDG